MGKYPAEHMPTLFHTYVHTRSCRACGEGEPEASILLCDGCDDAYHMQCLRPAIKAVPEGTWFCHKCEQDVQVCGGIARGRAGVEMLGGGRGRGGMQGTREGRLRGGQRRRQGREVACLPWTGRWGTRNATRCWGHQFFPLGDIDFPHLSAPHSSPGPPSQLCAMGGKEALACVSASMGVPEGRATLRGQGHFLPLLQGLRGMAHQQGQLLLRTLSSSSSGAGGAGGRGSGGGGGAVGLYCRTALHLALTAVLEPEAAGEGEGGAADAAAGTEASLSAAIGVLNEAMEMCEEVLEACVERRRREGSPVGLDGGEEGAEAEGGPALPRALVADCLGFVGSVLSVVADAQQLSVLDFGAGGGQQVRSFIYRMGYRVVVSTPRFHTYGLWIGCIQSMLALP